MSGLKKKKGITSRELLCMDIGQNGRLLHSIAV